MIAMMRATSSTCRIRSNIQTCRFVGCKEGEAVVAAAPYEACAVPGRPAFAVAFLTALRPTIAR
jgi:hypothetical protein